MCHYYAGGSRLAPPRVDGGAALRAQRRRDGRHVRGPRPPDAEHAHGLRQGASGRPAAGALRPGERRAPANDQDVDVGDGGRRVPPDRHLRRLLLSLLRLRPSRLDRAQQPDVHHHQPAAVRPLRVARHHRHRQDQYRSTQGQRNR